MGFALQLVEHCDPGVFKGILVRLATTPEDIAPSVEDVGQQAHSHGKFSGHDRESLGYRKIRIPFCRKQHAGMSSLFRPDLDNRRQTNSFFIEVARSTATIDPVEQWKVFTAVSAIGHVLLPNLSLERDTLPEPDHLA